MTTALLLGVSLTCVTLGGGCTAYQLALHPAASRPSLGVRGFHRSRALSNRVLRLLEPIVRYLAGWFSILPIASVRTRLRGRLREAGDCFGLSPDEFLSASVLCAVVLGGFGMKMVDTTYPVLVVSALVSLGLGLPWIVLVSRIGRRVRQVEHDLPAAVELAALCMGAGLDFPGSLRQIVDGAIGEDRVLVEEFERVLQELRLGYTRGRALERLAARVPSDALRQFCNSVVQAEEKGTPLVDALMVQARTLRLRRSVAAEERATGAALRLIGPMSLVFLCVLLLVLAPLVVRFVTGGFSVS